jgi:hypothetical protein
VFLFAFVAVLSAQQVASSLDLTATTLPPGFVPDDAQALFNQLSPAKKDEFETTAQYEARVGKPQLKPVYAFSVDLVDGSAHHARAGGTAKYDADAQEFTASLYPDLTLFQEFRSDMSARSLTLKSLTTSKRDYEGHNAYGASVTVHEENEDIYGIVIPIAARASDLKLDLSLSFKVPPDEAKEAKPNLALLVIASPPQDGGPLVSTGKWVVTATINNPYSSQDNYYYLRLQPKSVWAYNRKTGKVYAKFDNAFKR